MRTVLNPDVVRTFTRAEVCLMAGRIRRKPLPESTFYRWLDLNGISPKSEYSAEEVQQLLDTCQHFLNGGKAEDYVKQLIQEQNPHAH